MPKLSETRRKARTITLNWDLGDGSTMPIQVTYDPGAITLESQEIPTDNPDISLGDFWKLKATKYIKAWDLMDDNGQPLPIDNSGFAKMEAPMLSWMLAEIQQDSVPNLRNMSST